MNIIYKSLIYGVIVQLILVVSLFAQNTTKLKNFLWEKDFKSLIKNYAEENIKFSEEGNIQRRMEARSYIEKEGLRVQVFAGSDQKNAEAYADKMTKLRLDSVYIDESSGIFRVQIGNFSDRIEAEKMLDRLRFAGITNAWIINTIIHVPKVLSAEKVEEVTQAVADKEDRFLFSIQILVTSSYQKALLFQRKLKNSFSEEIWLNQQNGLWKILLGKFNDESNARSRLEVVRASGYPDAWLTQIDN